MILLIARVFDAFVDPIVGIYPIELIHGGEKYRPWILWTALPFAVFLFWLLPHLIFLNVEDFVCRNYLYFVDVDLFLQ